jgi:hypothetical protein
MIVLFTWLSIVLAFLSAAAWMRASLIKVATDQEYRRRERKASRTGESVSYAAVEIDGVELGSTLRAQSRWNAIGAGIAASATMIQAGLAAYAALAV